jgi:hypothetical protein
MMLLILGLSLSISAPSQAADKTALLTKAFQKYLVDGEAAYNQAISLAKNQYEPQISASQTKIALALLQFKNVNQAMVLNSPPPDNTELRNYISVLKCPANSDCKMPGTPTGGYSVGAITTIMDFVGGDQAFTDNSAAQMNLGILQTVDLGISKGLFKLSNTTEYNNVAATLRTQYQNLVSLSQQYSYAQSTAAVEREGVRDMQPVIASAILSAKRAGKNSSSFEKAFVASFKFEYNAKRLNELASMPWTYITSLKALNSAVSVTKSSLQADAVSSNYSFSSANKINSIYGNLFTSEEEFRNNLKLISEIYKSTTGIKLSI